MDSFVQMQVLITQMWMGKTRRIFFFYLPENPDFSAKQIRDEIEKKLNIKYWGIDY